MPTLHALKKMASPALENDKFCVAEKCPCPGQVNWHAGWKIQRMRGHHMALFYLGLFEEAVGKYKSLLLGPGLPAPDDARSVLQRRERGKTSIGASTKLTEHPRL